MAVFQASYHWGWSTVGAGQAGKKEGILAGMGLSTVDGAAFGRESIRSEDMAGLAVVG